MRITERGVRQSDNHVFFGVRGHRLTTTILEGTFPRCENVMPKSCETVLDVPTDERCTRLQCRGRRCPHDRL